MVEEAAEMRILGGGVLGGDDALAMKDDFGEERGVGGGKRVESEGKKKKKR